VLRDASAHWVDRQSEGALAAIHFTGLAAYPDQVLDGQACFPHAAIAERGTIVSTNLD
jgi:hypothetical protein